MIKAWKHKHASLVYVDKLDEDFYKQICEECVFMSRKEYEEIIAEIFRAGAEGNFTWASTEKSDERI